MRMSKIIIVAILLTMILVGCQGNPFAKEVAIEGPSAVHSILGLEEFDVDGDGDMERLYFSYQEDTNDYLIQLNDQIQYQGKGEFEGVYVSDLDQREPDKEIYVSYQDKGETYTDILSFDGERLKHIGKIQGHMDQITVHGNGSLQVKDVPGKVIHRWSHEEDYMLAEGLIQLVNSETEYQMNHAVTLKSDLLVEGVNGELCFTIKKGEKATLTTTDDFSWVKIKNAQGEEGKIYISGDGKKVIMANGKAMLAKNLFDGLILN